MEIEQKYRVKMLPEHLEQYECLEIEQGYLCSDPTVRIRKMNDAYILTYKSKIGMEDVDESVYRMNQEVEMPLHAEGYAHLRQKVDGNLIVKKRYKIPYETYTIELDIFEGKMEGLIVAEVEFPDEESTKHFVPPEWFGENVSGDHRYSNSYLSKLECFGRL